MRGVNAFLPPSISVQWAKQVPDDFHARFSARSRTYVYLLWRGRVRPALWAGRAGWCFQPLDVAAMRAAAGALLGEHDFSSFRSSQCQAKHPVRHLHRLDIEERGPFLVLRFGPTLSCIIWCATSWARCCRSGRAGTGGMDGAAAVLARPQARRADLRA